MALPDENVAEQRPTGIRERMRLIQHFNQHIWKRWQQEYVNALVNRPKWCEPLPNLQVNDMVVVKADNLPPTQWVLGRVSKVYPDAEGRVRFVDVRHRDGVFRRPIQKLGKLPIDE